MVDTVVRGTDLGQVRGVEQGAVTVFRGIPYAAAPQGELRFAAPAARTRWDGVRDCVAFGPAAPQLAPAPGAPPAWRPGDGLDCLTVNVWTPDPAGSGLPVLVWIHGGLWKHGATSMPQYDAALLAAAGTVLVTVNYRLGFEGFGHLPGAPDNRGLWDQLAALRWVHRNIAAFGGDPGLVTVAGQSAGAASVAYLLGAPAARGLFRRAIAQSIPAGCRTRSEAAEVTRSVAAAAGVPGDRDGFAGLAPEAILAVQDAPLVGGAAGHTAFGPVVDGELVTGPPWAAVGAGREVALICGFTHDEGLGQTPRPTGLLDLAAVARTFGLDAGAADAYRRVAPGGTDAAAFGMLVSDALVRMPTSWVAEAHARAGGRTWLYDFAWPSPTTGGAGHGIDIPFTFGNPTSRFAARVLGNPPPVEFAELSARVRAAWLGFAATGDPGWPRFGLADRCTRSWEVLPRDDTDPLADSRRIWPAPPR